MQIERFELGIQHIPPLFECLGAGGSFVQILIVFGSCDFRLNFRQATLFFLDIACQGA
jgi:hypothetical protein